MRIGGQRPTSSATADSRRKQARRRLRDITEKQGKLLEAHYANAIPLDLLKSEQDRLAAEFATATTLLESSEASFENIEANLERCLAFLTNCYEAYLSAPPKVRRQMNQAVFERFLISEDGALEAEPAGAFGVLLSPDLIKKRSEVDDAASADQQLHRNGDWHNGFPARLWGLINTKPRPTFAGLGSKESQLVPPTGFEPVLPP